jgi:hypothetical protein
MLAIAEDAFAEEAHVEGHEGEDEREAEDCGVGEVRGELALDEEGADAFGELSVACRVQLPYRCAC